MAAVPFFDMDMIRETMKKNEHLLLKANECLRKRDLAGALEYRLAFNKPLGAYPYFCGTGMFWSICGEVVSRYGNDAAYAMLWNPDWCDKERFDGSPNEALCVFYQAINLVYRKEGFANPYEGGLNGSLIEYHRFFQDYSRTGWSHTPTEWTADETGLWHGHQTGNELMKPIRLFSADELYWKARFHVFIQTGGVREILTVNSRAEEERMNCHWHFWSRNYGFVRSSTPLADVVKDGYFKAEIPLRGGRFTSWCSDERVIATLKAYLEGLLSEGDGLRMDKLNTDIRILDAATANKIYERFSIPRYTLVHESTIT